MSAVSSSPFPNEKAFELSGSTGSLYALLALPALSESGAIIVPGEDHGWTFNPEYVVKMFTDWLVMRLAPEAR